MSMSKALIIDDDTCRVGTIRAWARRHGIRGDVVHSTVFDTGLLGEADVVFLDHDLGSEDVYSSLRGVDFSLLQDTVFIVHSMNPVGAANLVTLLKDNGIIVFRVPFSIILMEN